MGRTFRCMLGAAWLPKRRIPKSQAAVVRSDIMLPELRNILAPPTGHCNPRARMNTTAPTCLPQARQDTRVEVE